MTSDIFYEFLDKNKDQALKMPNKKPQSKNLVKLKQQYKEKKSIN